jgi:hypothetical protein
MMALVVGLRRVLLSRIANVEFELSKNEYTIFDSVLTYGY